MKKILSLMTIFILLFTQVVWAEDFSKQTKILIQTKSDGTPYTSVEENSYFLTKHIKFDYQSGYPSTYIFKQMEIGIFNSEGQKVDSYGTGKTKEVDADGKSWAYEDIRFNPALFLTGEIYTIKIRATYTVLGDDLQTDTTNWKDYLENGEKFYFKVSVPRTNTGEVSNGSPSLSSNNSSIKNSIYVKQFISPQTIVHNFYLATLSNPNKFNFSFSQNVGTVNMDLRVYDKTGKEVNKYIHEYNSIGGTTIGNYDLEYKKTFGDLFLVVIELKDVDDKTIRKDFYSIMIRPNYPLLYTLKGDKMYVSYDESVATDIVSLRAANSSSLGNVPLVNYKPNRLFFTASSEEYLKPVNTYRGGWVFTNGTDNFIKVGEENYIFDRETNSLGTSPLKDPVDFSNLTPSNAVTLNPIALDNEFSYLIGGDPNLFHLVVQLQDSPWIGYVQNSDVSSSALGLNLTIPEKDEPFTPNIAVSSYDGITNLIENWEVLKRHFASVEVLLASRQDYPEAFKETTLEGVKSKVIDESTGKFNYVPETQKRSVFVSQNTSDPLDAKWKDFVQNTGDYLLIVRIIPLKSFTGSPDNKMAFKSFSFVRNSDSYSAAVTNGGNLEINKNVIRDAITKNTTSLQIATTEGEDLSIGGLMYQDKVYVWSSAFASGTTGKAIEIFDVDLKSQGVIESSPVHKIIAHKNKILVATDTGLFELQGNSLSATPITTPVYSLASNGNTLLVGTDTGLFAYKTLYIDKTELTSAELFKVPSPVVTIEQNNNIIMVTSKNGEIVSLQG